MKAYTINSIQQVGVGTENFRKTWNWMIDMFGFDVKILEDDTVAERMLPYTGGIPQKRHACIAVNLQGGGGMEIWQYSGRIPKKAEFEPAPGDLGIFAAKIKCRDIKVFHRKVSAKWDKCSDIFCDPCGVDCFYMKDLYGNAFQLVENRDVYIEDNKLCGGIAGAMIGVSDMGRSVQFYRELLGYDTVIYDKTGVFGDLRFLGSSDAKYRRVLLGRSVKPSGPFAGLLGDNTLELVQVLDHQARKIYEGRYWGDPGFIQICFDVCGMKALGEFCASKDHPFTVDSCPGGERFDMGEASGHFTYIEDPDGTLIEFVETHRIPLVGKLGLYINLDRHQRPLPKFLFRIMGLVSRQ